jgi:hypothetical protein
MGRCSGSRKSQRPATNRDLKTCSRERLPLSQLFTFLDTLQRRNYLRRSIRHNAVLNSFIATDIDSRAQQSRAEENSNDEPLDQTSHWIICRIMGGESRKSDALRRRDHSLLPSLQLEASPQLISDASSVPWWIRSPRWSGRAGRRSAGQLGRRRSPRMEFRFMIDRRVSEIKRSKERPPGP